MSEITRHHVLMALAYAISGGRGAALLIKHGGGPPRMFLSTDMHHAYPGHSPAVNVIQHVFRLGDWSMLTDVDIYLTARPTDADLGIFIEQTKQANGKSAGPRLYYENAGTIVAARPSKLVAPPLNVKAVIPVIRLNYGMPITRLNGIWGGLAMAGATAVSLFSGTAAIAAADQALVGWLLGNRRQTEADVLRRYGVVPYEDDGTSPPFDQAWFQAMPYNLTFHNLSPEGQRLFDSLFLLLCYALASHSPPIRGKHGGSAKVGAVMVAPDGTILSWGVDFSATFHAEVSTIKLYQDGGLAVDPPEGTRFFTTLEPCFMCSGLIATAYGHIRGFTVLYGQVDPAVRQAANTFLKHHGTIRELQSITRYDLGGAKGTFADRLNLKGTQDLGAFKPKVFQKSVMQQLEVPSFRRRFTKAALDLLAMPYVIDLETDGQERLFLLHTWQNAMRLLSKAKGVPVEPLFREFGAYLDATRGQNPAKQKDESYQKRAQSKQTDNFREMADLFLRAFWRG